jgi:hypothetical protein
MVNVSGQSVHFLLADSLGNKILFDRCLAGDDEYTAEYALTSIRYSAIENDEPLHSIAFVYEQREDVHAPFVAVMQLQESLRLTIVQMVANGKLVRQYDFHYAKNATTKRTS